MRSENELRGKRSTLMYGSLDDNGDDVVSCCCCSITLPDSIAQGRFKWKCEDCGLGTEHTVYICCCCPAFATHVCGEGYQGCNAA